MNIEFLDSSIDNFVRFLNTNYQLVTQSYEMLKLKAEKEKFFLGLF